MTYYSIFIVYFHSSFRHVPGTVTCFTRRKQPTNTIAATAINKSDIFNWKNVRRLRWLGVALLLNFISEAVPALMNDYELSSVFSLSGYSMETSIDSVMLVILGLVSLIVGEVFAIGLKMKEEQDLTI